MELVYLWVEEYKNIHHQGFNFSPRFRCDYDPATNELTIDENEDYIPNFFGDNINVTAIVGKNGSGKSSIIKILYLLMYLYNNRDAKAFAFEGDNRYYFLNKTTNIFNILTSYKDLGAFFIINERDTFYKVDINQLKSTLIEEGGFGVSLVFEESVIKLHGKNVENYSDDISSFFVYFNDSIDTFKDNKLEGWVEELYHRTDGYSTPLLIEPAKYNDKINLTLQNSLSNQRLLLFYRDMTSSEIGNITTFFNPDKIKFDNAESQINSLILRDIEENSNNLFNDESTAKYGSQNEFTIESIKTHPYKIVTKYINYVERKTDSSDLFSVINFEFIASLYDLYKSKNYKILNLLYIAFKSIEKKDFMKDSSIESITAAVDIESIESITSAVEEAINSSQLIDDSKLRSNEYKVIKIKVAVEFFRNNYHEKLSEIEKEEIPLIELPKDVLNIFPAWIEVEFFEKTKSLSSLSTGEKFKFIFLISLHQLRNLLSEEKYQSVYLFFDEIEMGFHPEWQKSFLKELLHALKGNDRLLQTYFLTHSPFLLSDIPKQNIIFLGTDEDGKCKVLTHDQALAKQQTFGQNIHTLLSDSFFMEDGLMGEFAENKINDAIQYLRGENDIYRDKQKELFNLIDIIGEPFLKKKLLELYYEKFNDEATKAKRKEELEQQRDSIERELSRL